MVRRAGAIGLAAWLAVVAGCAALSGFGPAQGGEGKGFGRPHGSGGAGFGPAQGSGGEPDPEPEPEEPDDILGSKLFAWYDPSDGATVTLSGSEVTALADKSTNGYDLTRLVSGPDLDTTTLERNSLRFELSSSEMLEVDGTAPWRGGALGDEVVLWVVVKPDAGVTNNWIVALNDKSRGGSGFYAGVTYLNTTPGYRGIETAAAASTVDTSAVSPSDGVYVVRYHMVSTNNRRIAVDGGGEVVGTDSNLLSSSDVTHLCVGGFQNSWVTAYWDGWIGEVVMAYDSPSPEQIAAVDAYLAARWKPV